MRLFFANKFFTFKGSSKVTDENKQLQFYIKGKFFTFTRKNICKHPKVCLFSLSETSIGICFSTQRSFLTMTIPY